MMNILKKLRYKISICIICLFYSFSIKAQDATWEWAKSFGSDGLEHILEIKNDAEGNTYFSAYSKSDTLQIGNVQIRKNPLVSANYIDFIVKLNSEGSVLWVKSWQTNRNIFDFLLKQNGEIEIISSFFGSTYYSDDFPIDVSSISTTSYTLKIKLLSDGTTVDYTYNQQNATAKLSSVFHSYYYQNGTFSSTINLGSFSLNNSNGNNYIAKLDSNNQVLWARTFSSASCWIDQIVANQEGEVFLMGSFTSEDLTIDNLSITNANIGSGIISSDVFFAKLNADGQAEWLYSVGEENIDQPGSMVMDKEGNITAVGSFYGTTCNINGTILVGNGSCANTFIITFDKDFSILKSKSFGSENNNRSTNIAYNGTNYYVLGHVQGSMTIDGISFELDVSTINEFIIELNSNLDLINSYWMENVGNNFFIDLHYAQNNNFYVIGSYRLLGLTFGPHVLSSTTTTDNYDIFIAKLHLGEYAGLQSEKESEKEILVYPNPNNGRFEIKNKSLEKTSFKISNALGQEIYNGSLNSENKLVDLNLEEGVYVLTLWNGTVTKKEKFIIQQ